VIRRIFFLAGVFFLLVVAPAAAGPQEAAPPPAQEAAPAKAEAQEAAPAPAVPAATRSQIDCAGFIGAGSLAADHYVFDGADNDLRLAFHEFLPGGYVFLKRRGKEAGQVGTEYRLVRPANESVLHDLFSGDIESIRTFSHPSWYPGQAGSIRSLGKAYDDVGIVKVTALTPKGAVAQVTFACQPVEERDLAIPFQAREIPAYNPNAALDSFAQPSGKLMGAITAASSNAGVVGQDSTVYINLGESDGVHAGQHFRIFNIDWDVDEGWWRAAPDTPAETLGELLILSTQEKSSVGLVVSSVREIFLGDGVVLE